MTDANEPITLHEAADRLGVHYMTAYRYVRLGRLPAQKSGGEWRVDPRDLGLARAAASGRSSPRPGDSKRTRGPTRAPWAARLQQRMVCGDVEGSWQLIESAMASGLDPADAYVEILTPALHAIGDGWQQGTLGIEQEHLATGVATAIVGRLGPRFRRRGRPHGTIVVAMPVGERHALGVSMLVDILRGDGFLVLNLGPDTPPKTLAAAMREADSLTAVVVSVVDSAHLRAAERLIRAARGTNPGVIVVAGGRAIRNELVARSIGADGWAADPRRLADLIDGLRSPTDERRR